jgi:hypothetical protein
MSLPGPARSCGVPPGPLYTRSQTSNGQEETVRQKAAQVYVPDPVVICDSWPCASPTATTSNINSTRYGQ